MSTYMLVLCPECQRHVRAADAQCPFCGCDHLPAAVPFDGRRLRGLGRAAVFALGATLGAAGCDGTTPGMDGGPRDAGPDAPWAIGDAYGAPPVDAAMFDAAYGGPPADAGDPEP
jgi:hypothetical protein